NLAHCINKCLYQSVVMVSMSSIEDDYTVARQVRMNRLEELTCRELERNIWLLKSINRHNIILGLYCIDKRPSIFLVNVQVRLIHAKICSSHVDNRGINLCSINRNRSIYLRKLMGNSTCCQANYAYTMQFFWRKTRVKVRRCQKIIPVPTRKYSVGIGIVDGMDSLSLIENELS